MNLIENILFPISRGAVTGGIASATFLGRVVSVAAFETTVVYRWQQIFTHYLVTETRIKDTIDHTFPEQSPRCRQFRNIANYSTKAVQLMLASAVTYSTALYFGTSLTLAQLFKMGCIVIVSTALCEFVKIIVPIGSPQKKLVQLVEIFKQLGVLINQDENTFLQERFINATDFKTAMSKISTTITEIKADKFKNVYKRAANEERRKVRTLIKEAQAILNSLHWDLTYIDLVEKF